MEHFVHVHQSVNDFKKYMEKTSLSEEMAAIKTYLKSVFFFFMLKCDTIKQTLISIKQF